MAVHMLRVFIDPDADSTLVEPETGFIATWLNNFTAWEDEQHTNDDIELRKPKEKGDGISYYAADWRFDWSESREELVDNLEGHIDAYANWHRILYHECTHDEDDGGPCSWDYKYEAGDVPGDIPNADL